MKTTSLLCYCFISSTLAFSDWPQFRGPNANGHSTATNLPTSWSDTKNVKWKTPVPEGWSSPILVDDCIYLTAAQTVGGGEKPDLSLRTLCLNAENGNILWDKEIYSIKGNDLPRIHKKNSHATPTPTIENSKLYVHFGHQGTAQLNLDGNILWKTNPLDYPPMHGQGCSPIIVGNSLFFSCDGATNPFVICIDKNNGKELWRTKRTTQSKKTFSFCTPTLITVSGKPQIISPGSGAIFAYEPSSGQELWTAPWGDGYSVIPKPLFAHGLIFASSGFDRPVLMAVKPGGKVVWKIDRQAPHTPSMLAIGNELYFVSDRGIMSCVDARTGKEHWQERVCGSISASPTFGDGKIYIQDESGKCVIIQPGKVYRTLGENELNERTLASYAVSDGALFIRGNKHLFRIGR